MHEYIIVTRKPKLFAPAWMVSIRRTERYQADQRDVKSQPRLGIVWIALAQLGGSVSLTEIYSEMSAHARQIAKEKSHDWQSATTRRFLQETCQSVERGVWALATITG